jgi:hypothetical protein
MIRSGPSDERNRSRGDAVTRWSERSEESKLCNAL